MLQWTTASAAPDSHPADQAEVLLARDREGLSSGAIGRRFRIDKEVARALDAQP